MTIVIPPNWRDTGVKTINEYIELAEKIAGVEEAEIDYSLSLRDHPQLVDAGVIVMPEPKSMQRMRE